MIEIRSGRELDRIRKAGEIVARCNEYLAPRVEPGMTTLALDSLAHEFYRQHDAVPAFLNYRVGKLTFPHTLCVSINEQVVHGMPGPRAIQAGDLVSVDNGAKVDGYYGDAAYSVIMEPVSEAKRKLLEVTRAALYLGIAQARPGNRVGDIGDAVQRHVEGHGYSVVRELVGHGIGTRLHEEPQVPNYGKPHTGPLLRPGMAIAIEPMVNTGRYKVKTLDDGWTVVTEDGAPSCHFEHTIIITQDEPIITTHCSLY